MNRRAVRLILSSRYLVSNNQQRRASIQADFFSVSRFPGPYHLQRWIRIFASQHARTDSRFGGPSTENPGFDERRNSRLYRDVAQRLLYSVSPSARVTGRYGNDLAEMLIVELTLFVQMIHGHGAIFPCMMMRITGPTHPQSSIRSN